MLPLMLFSLLLRCQLALAATTFSPVDLSILLPLPQSKLDHAQMLSPLSGDVLLPLQVYQSLPRIVLDLTQKHVYDHALKVVGVRIDPCFREDNGPCQKQIRLVWQPFVFEENEWTTLDAAFHTFYNVRDWDGLLRELALLHTPSPALVPHPQLAKEGYQGPFWQKLSALLLKHCNPVTLSQATIMAVNPLGNVWFFSGVRVKESGQLPRIEIPRIEPGAPVQGFITSLDSRNAEQFRAAMNPAPTGDDEFLSLLRDSRNADKKLGEAGIIEATRQALRLENPRLTNPGNTDCVSCHAARVVPEWSGRNFPAWNWSTLFSREIFAGARGASPEQTGLGTNVLRLFGYFGTKPVIARRVKFETEESLRQL